MKQLRYISIISIISIILFFYAGAKEITSQTVIKLIADHTILNDTHDNSIGAVYDNGCECIKYNCGCCTYIVWDVVSLKGTLCANASYLEHDYGISVTLTFNTLTIINETVSARNPPPICIGEDIVDSVEAEICLRIYDIDIEHFHKYFHACFEILGRVMKIHISSIKLGCFNTKLHKNMQYIVDNTVNDTSNISLSVPKQARMIAYSQGSLPSRSLIEIFLFFIFFYWISVVHDIILISLSYFHK